MLERFLGPFEGISSSGLEPTDEDFIAIVSAVEKTAWEDLEDRIASLDGERVYDVRIAAFACYLAWRAEGFRALPWIHEAIVAVAGEGLSAFGPERKKVAHLDVRISWALSTISDDITYHEKHATSEWAAWTKGVDAALADRVSETRSPARAALEQAGATRAADALGREASAVDKCLMAIVPPPPPPPPPARSEAASPSFDAPEEPEVATGPASFGGRDFDADDEAGPWSAQPASVAAPASRAPRLRTKDLANGGQVVQLAVSPAFVDLVRKLEAFEALVERGKYQKAALVADDLTETISRFDPRTYFPELFASFGKSLAENIEVLGEHWEERESLGWKALEQFYRVDLKRFVDS